MRISVTCFIGPTCWGTPCDCQQSHEVPQRVPMAEALLALHPLERVSMDILELPQAPMRWGITILDQHSRYIQIVPLKDITASSVHQAFLNNWVTLTLLMLSKQTMGGSLYLRCLRKLLKCSVLPIISLSNTTFNPMVSWSALIMWSKQL